MYDDGYTIKKYVAHGICMNKDCGYVGDMRWYRWKDHDEDIAVCPECTWDIPYGEMSKDAEERDRLWNDE